MTGRRHNLFGKRRAYTGESRRPVSWRSKMIYVMSVLSAGVFVATIAISYRMDGDAVKLFAGGGVCLLMVSVMLMLTAARSLKDESEPMPARLLAVVMAGLSMGLWTYLYVVGLLNA